MTGPSAGTVRAARAHPLAPADVAPIRPPPVRIESPAGAQPVVGNAAVTRSLTPVPDAPAVGTVEVAVGAPRSVSGASPDAAPARTPARSPARPPAVAADPAPPAAEDLSLPPFQVERPMPFVMPTRLPSFAPTRWELPPTRDAAREPEEARRRARTRHDALQALVRRRHDGVVAHAEDVQRAVRASGEHFIDALPAPIERVDAALERPLGDHLAAIDMAAHEAHALVLGAERRARARIAAAWEQGSAAVANNLRTAADQITVIVDGLASRYGATLEAAATSCLDLAMSAQGKIDRWARSAPTAWPAGVGGVVEAEHETKRLTTTQRAAALQPALNEQGSRAAASFRDQIAPTRTGLATSVEPPLQARKNAIEEHGQQSLDDARVAARAALREQSRQARGNVEAMRIDARARVFAQRRSARAQIEATATRAGKDARREADAAQQAIGSALAPSLSVYGTTLGQVRSNLVEASARSPAALDRTGEAALVNVDGVTARAATAQTTRIDATLAGVDDGMARREREVGVEADGQAAAAEASMAATAETDLPVFTESARVQTEGFSRMSAGVEAATPQWSQPIAETYAAYIIDVRTDLDRRHDEAVDGHPAFVTQVTDSKVPFVLWVTPMLMPAVTYAPDLEAAWTHMRENLTNRAHAAGDALTSGIIDVVDENALSRALRNITAAQATAIRALYLERGGRSIDEMLEFRMLSRDLDVDEYQLATTYLSGNARAGNLLELDVSRGWINDDEARMQEVLRSLSQEELDALHSTEGWSDTLERVRGVLGGTDLAVFDALEQGAPARADAILWRERIDAARVRGDIDGLNDVAAEYTGASMYLGNPVDAETRRRMVVAELAGLLRDGKDVPAGVAADADAATVVAAYGTRRTAVMRTDWLRTTVVEEGVTGPGADLFGDIVRHGAQSVEARQSSLAVEFAREGGPDMLRLDRALVDPRLNPNLYPGGVIPEETLTAARADRAALASGFARRYGEPGAGSTGATGYLSERIDRAFGTDRYGAAIGNLLLYEEVPSPETASHLMRYGMTHATGTNEALLERVAGRMNRDEIRRMTEHYDSFGSSLHEDLGVYGQGTWGELSGDERLSMEVRLLGVPRNDRERAEVAAFTAQQQRDETGTVGGWLTSGGFQDRALAYEMDRLRTLSGITVRRDDSGVPVFSGGDSHFRDGRYVGGDRAEFEAAVSGAEVAARAYAARVDAWANFAVNSIMVAGAVLATVLTAGGAGPLLLAAVAAGTGLTAMVAQRMISGGRYGWEKALTDLGATLVQALTAGLGATLGLASRGGSAAVRTGLAAGLRPGGVPQSLVRAGMGRLTGTALGDTVLIGATTNALNMAGTTALSEETWEKGFRHGVGEVLTGSGIGLLTGGLSAGVGHGLGAIVPARLPGLARVPALAGSPAKLSELIGRAGPVVQGLGQGGIGAISGFVGRYAELGLQASRGRYPGDAGDLFMEARDAGALAGLQSFGEGVGEWGMENRMNRRAMAPVRAHEGLTPPTLRASTAGDQPAIPTLELPGMPRPALPAAEPEAGGAPPVRRPPEGDGPGDDGRPPRGPPPDDDRLFPGLTDAEIDHAFREAEAGPHLRVGAEQPGADLRPLPNADTAIADMRQRQRAGALLNEADAVAADARALLQRAVDIDSQAALTESYNRRRARVLRDEATALLDQAIATDARARALRNEAAEFSSGRRSASEDLPGPEDVDTLFDQLKSPGLVRVPLSDVERHPEMMPRLVRALLEGDGGGRMVFRVESERSRSLVSVDADGNVRVAGAAAVHLNFGSFERAVEFLLNNTSGDARIIAFEVDEAWLRSVRSAAIPEHETAALGGSVPRVVDVRFADDQLEIPASLVPELNRFIVPGSGVVHEFPATAPRGGGPDDERGTHPAPRRPDDRTASGVIPHGAEPPRVPSAPAADTVAALTAAGDQWIEQMRRSIRGEGPPPEPWRGSEPQLDAVGSWRGNDPAEAYAAYLVALREGGGRYEAIIVRDRLSGECHVMLGGQASVSPPARGPGRAWETVMHYHPNLQGALRFTLPAQLDLLQAFRVRLGEGRPPGLTHVEFVESMIDGQRTRVAIVVDDAGMRLEIGAGAGGHSGPARGGEVVPVSSFVDYLRWWRSQSGGTPLPPPADPGGTRWVAPGSQEQRELLAHAAEVLGHDDVARRIAAAGPESSGLPAPVHTMEGTLPVAPAAIPDVAELLALRAEEHARMSSLHEASALHATAYRIVRDAEDSVGRAEAELAPLQARRQSVSGELDDVVARQVVAREARDRIVVPGDDEFDADARRAFMVLESDARRGLQDAARALDRELLALGGERSEHEAAMQRLQTHIGGLNRRIAEGRRQIDTFAPTRDRLVVEIAEQRARLDEIALRRGAATGDFVAEYDRVGERPPCFAAGTLVHLAGGVRAIERVAEGEAVHAFDVECGAATVRRVLRAECGRTMRLVDIDVAGERLTCTPQHRFWVPERGAWLPASDLEPRMRLLDRHGAWHAIVSRAGRVADVPTFNLLVDRDHDYFVGQAGLLVHNGKDPDDLTDSIFRDELMTPVTPFVVRYYVIVHESDPDTIIYVGSTERSLADRLRGHVSDRVYLRGPNAGLAWFDEGGGRVVVVRSADGLQARSGPFIMREIAQRECRSHFERFVWEHHFIENLRLLWAATMQNDFATPPIGRAKFTEFLDYYLARLCAR